MDISLGIWKLFAFFDEYLLFVSFSIFSSHYFYLIICTYTFLSLSYQSIFIHISFYKCIIALSLYMYPSYLTIVLCWKLIFCISFFIFVFLFHFLFRFVDVSSFVAFPYKNQLLFLYIWFCWCCFTSTFLVCIEVLKHAPNLGMRHRRDSISGLSTHSQPMVFGSGFGTQSPAPSYHSGGLRTMIVWSSKSNLIGETDKEGWTQHCLIIWHPE